MANNVARYGFRYKGNLEGGQAPRPIECTVATGYHGQVSATDVDINIGDPVQFVSTGTVELAAGAGSPSTLWGVVVSVNNVRGVGINGLHQPFNRVPAGTTWTLEADRTKVGVIPFGRNIWEVDVDDNTTATTLAAYRLLIGENCDLSYTLDTTVASRPKATPRLDISTHASTTKDFRIIDISHTAENQDFSGTGVKLLVVVNESGEAPFVTAGV